MHVYTCNKCVLCVRVCVCVVRIVGSYLTVVAKAGLSCGVGVLRGTMPIVGNSLAVLSLVVRLTSGRRCGPVCSTFMPSFLLTYKQTLGFSRAVGGKAGLT